MKKIKIPFNKPFYEKKSIQDVQSSLHSGNTSGKGPYTKNCEEFLLKENNLSIKKTIKEYQNFIKKNFDYVGSNFAYEARSIHYDKKKRNKGIFGKASKKDIIELKEEGIETQSIPWFNDKKN